METIKIKWSKASELGIRWADVAEKMNYDRYAMKEGLVTDDSYIDVPMTMVVEAMANK